jgi:F-type H+-transporting ATPase subunit epsilon
VATIQVLVVTPEATQLDAQAESVSVPLVDGEAGILPGHAPMIGRLAPGELRVVTSAGQKQFYVDGGFVQVADNVVSVLTGRSITFDQIDVAAARRMLEETRISATDKAEAVELKNRTLAQARAMLRLSGQSTI